MVDIAQRRGVNRTTPHVWRARGELPPPRWLVNDGATPLWEWAEVHAHLTSAGLPSRTENGRPKRFRVSRICPCCGWKSPQFRTQGEAYLALVDHELAVHNGGDVE